MGTGGGPGLPGKTGGAPAGGPGADLPGGGGGGLPPFFGANLTSFFGVCGFEDEQEEVGVDFSLLWDEELCLGGTRGGKSVGLAGGADD